MSKSATRTPRQSANPLSGPGSLVNAQARFLMKCLACGSANVTTIVMTLTDGSLVDFASCHRCEHRWWLHQGVPLSLDTVLAKTRKIA